MSFRYPVVRSDCSFLTYSYYQLLSNEFSFNDRFREQLMWVGTLLLVSSSVHRLINSDFSFFFNYQKLLVNLLFRKSLWMFRAFCEKLRRSHTKVISLLFIRLKHSRIHLLSINLILISNSWKYVKHLLPFLTLLLTPKDQINPLMQLTRHLLSL